MQDFKLLLIILIVLILGISLIPYNKEKFQVDFDDLNNIVSDSPPVDASKIKNLNLDKLKTKNLELNSKWKHNTGSDYELKRNKDTHIKISGNKDKAFFDTKNFHVTGDFKMSKNGGFKGGDSHTISMGDKNHSIEVEHGNGMLVSSFDRVKFGTGSNKDERMRITGDGKVGVGTQNPEAKFDVQGGFVRVGNHTLRSVENKLTVCDEQKKKCKSINF